MDFQQLMDMRRVNTNYERSVDAFVRRKYWRKSLGIIFPAPNGLNNANLPSYDIVLDDIDVAVQVLGVFGHLIPNIHIHNNYNRIVFL